MVNTGGADALLTLSQRQARTLAAMAARIFPSDDLGIGATEAGVIFYIDRSLAGAYADLLPRYLEGIAAVDACAMTRHQAHFAALTPEQQDTILHAIEDGTVPGCAPAFLNLVIGHTREGMFCDPAYGGNRGLAGWQLLGFPGVQLTYTPEEQMGAPIYRARIGTMADVNYGLPLAVLPSAPREER